MYFPEASKKRLQHARILATEKDFKKQIKIKSLTLSFGNQTYRKREVFVICLKHLDKHKFLKNDK